MLPLPQEIQPLDVEALRQEFSTAKPFPFICIDRFLEPAFADRVAAAYPSYDEARRMGKEFSAVNEKLKVQITDRTQFPKPVARLAEVLAAREFLERLEIITSTPRLLSDDALDGGGMHLTDASGRLDVHVDFNVKESPRLFRRLNILIYLNPEWQSAWGGDLELWDSQVRNCHQVFSPKHNRCVIFATSEISFHGVSSNKCPTGQVRKSFAAYYYTREAPGNWDGTSHSTVFKARPTEPFRKTVLMPAEKAQRALNEQVRKAKRIVKGWLG